MSAFVAARSALRSSATKLAGGSNRARASSAFSIPKLNPAAQRNCRSPVETSSVLVESMLPYHTATASALLQSMLCVNRSLCGWNPEELHKTLIDRADVAMSAFVAARSAFRSVGAKRCVEAIKRSEALSQLHVFAADAKANFSSHLQITVGDEQCVLGVNDALPYCYCLCTA